MIGGPFWWSFLVVIFGGPFWFDLDIGRLVIVGSCLISMIDVVWSLFLCFFLLLLLNFLYMVGSAKNEDIEMHRQETASVRQKLKIVVDQYETQLQSRDNRVQFLKEENHKAVQELHNLKNFLRQRNRMAGGDEGGGGEQQQGRVSAEDVVKKSLEMQQPMLLRVSRSSLRAIPRPDRKIPKEVGGEAKELNGSLAMEDSLKGAIEDTGFVML